MFGFFFICEHTASHFSQLNVREAPTIRMYLFSIGMGTISGHGLPRTSSVIKHFDTCGHALVENESWYRDCGTIC